MAIYFFYSEDTRLIKIGYSRSPERLLERVTEVRRAIKGRQPIRILGVQDGEVGQERRIHQKFAPYRVKGEWFKPHRDLLAYIFDDTAPVEVWRSLYEQKQDALDRLDFRSKVVIGGLSDYRYAAPRDLAPRFHRLAAAMGVDHNILGQHILNLFLDNFDRLNQGWLKETPDEIEHNKQVITFLVSCGILKAAQCRYCARVTFAVVNERCSGPYCADCDIPDQTKWFQRYTKLHDGEIGVLEIQPWQPRPKPN